MSDSLSPWHRRHFRQHPAAVKASYGFAGFLACLIGSVSAMAIVMVVRNDPAAEPAMLAVLLPATIGLSATEIALLHAFAHDTRREEGGRPKQKLTRQTVG